MIVNLFFTQYLIQKKILFQNKCFSFASTVDSEFKKELTAEFLYIHINAGHQAYIYKRLNRKITYFIAGFFSTIPCAKIDHRMIASKPNLYG